MAIEYHISLEHDLLIAHASGVVTADNFIAVLNDLVPSTGGAALMKNVLITFDKRTAFHELDFAALQRIKDCITRWNETYPGRSVRTALVMEEGAGSSLFQLWQAMADAYPIGTQVRIFQSTDPALVWLKER